MCGFTCLKRLINFVQSLKERNAVVVFVNYLVGCSQEKLASHKGTTKGKLRQSGYVQRPQNLTFNTIT